MKVICNFQFHAAYNVSRRWDQHVEGQLVNIDAQRLPVAGIWTQDVRIASEFGKAATWWRARAPAWLKIRISTAAVEGSTIQMCARAVLLQYISRATVLGLTAMHMMTEQVLSLAKTPITISYLVNLWQLTEVHYKMAVVRVSALCSDTTRYNLSCSFCWRLKNCVVSRWLQTCLGTSSSSTYFFVFLSSFVMVFLVYFIFFLLFFLMFNSYFLYRIVWFSILYVMFKLNNHFQYLI
jgi:hypothetical protein